MGRKTLAETLEVKQVGVEVELLKESHSDIVADTQETSKEPIVKLFKIQFVMYIQIIR